MEIGSDHSFATELPKAYGAVIRVEEEETVSENASRALAWEEEILRDGGDCPDGSSWAKPYFTDKKKLEDKVGQRVGQIVSKRNPAATMRIGIDYFDPHAAGDGLRVVTTQINYAYRPEKEDRLTDKEKRAIREFEVMDPFTPALGDASESTAYYGLMPFFTQTAKAILAYCRDNRERSLALTKLGECKQWVISSIRSTYLDSLEK